MLVTEVSTLINWSDNVRNFITRKTFKYEEGNDVTVVAVNAEKFNLYDNRGEEENIHNKGTNVDIRA